MRNLQFALKLPARGMDSMKADVIRILEDVATTAVVRRRLGVR